LSESAGAKPVAIVMGSLSDWAAMARAAVVRQQPKD
jgi:phosphoribosylcarboxyaminoimidazole (NCAIR) mutase